MNRNKFNVPSHFVLLTLLIVCVAVLFFSFATGFAGGPLQAAADFIFAPMQKGINSAGGQIYKQTELMQSKRELQAENEELSSRVSELETKLTNMQLQESELERLQELYKLDKTYSDYPTTGAHVIARGTSNWFNTFTIDKGSADGITRDMNVIAGSGLCGIVTDVGTHYSIVRALIDDTTNVSAQIVSTEDNCIVSGDLKEMNESNMIDLSELEDSSDKVESGDAVVTSNISDKYLPGILIGYVTNLTEDENGLTKSGTITPVVDFKHLSDVLVITKIKETGDAATDSNSSDSSSDTSSESSE